MDDPGLVRGLDRAGDLNCDVEYLGHGKPAVGKVTSQRIAFDELRCDEMCAVGIAYLVDRNDVRVIERRCGLCFLDEPPQPTLVIGVTAGQQFEGHLAAEL